MQKGQLILIPSLLGGNNYSYCLPPVYKEILANIRYFIVEDIRTARRFLKPGGYSENIDALTFFVLNKHTRAEEHESFLAPTKDGSCVGLLSEAGVPCIADPGAQIVSLAHRNNIKVVPLVGPSSILLALMASGFNGQQFRFHGYLPIKPLERRKSIKDIEMAVVRNSETHIFIETPYRNMSLLKDILEAGHPNTKLCIACNLTLPDEFIHTRTLAGWKHKFPDLSGKYVVYLIGR